MSDLRARAARLGIETEWEDVHGAIHEVAPASIEALLAAMGEPGPAVDIILAEPGAMPILPADATGPFSLLLEDGTLQHGESKRIKGDLVLPRPVPMGYHEVTAGGRRMRIIAAPLRCLAPGDLGIGSGLGISAQLYALRGERPRGMGTFGDLAELARIAAGEGIELIGLNPLHALFPAAPGDCSPYAPSSRLFLNILYIDIDKAAVKLGVCVPAMAEPDGPEIDHTAVAAVRMQGLEALFAACPEPEGFELFLEMGGRPLFEHCLFEAMQETALAADPHAFAPSSWPKGWQAPDTEEARAFAKANEARIRFFAFCQWLADEQLAEAQAEARDAGMPIGLYRDLAVGVNPAGAMVWSHPGLSLAGVSIGAPPDSFSPMGQSWGLAPMAPAALEATGFDAFIAEIRATMRHAGAIRIDHVIGLNRQWWVPDGLAADSGAYVRFPLEIMTRILALESHRNRCLVIGEDLGTVPDGFRETMQARGILSCSVLWFERDEEGNFIPPAKWPKSALASLSTHDLPTARGFWQGTDIGWRERLGLFPDAARATAERKAREEDRARLVAALAGEGLIEPGTTPHEDELVFALHRYLGRTSAALVMIQAEDLDGWVDQVNLPGTVEGHPNWRRRLQRTTRELLAGTPARTLLAAMITERQR